MANKRKIAIMVLAHKNEDQVNRLVTHLSKDFDVFVHIDKRSSMKIHESENVFVYKKYNVYWGSFNQILTTLFLLKAAYKKEYERYILISGQDVPIKTNEYIKSFFENNEAEYIKIEKIPTVEGWPNMEILTKYHFNRANKRHGSHKIIREIMKSFGKLMSKVKPRKLDYDFYGGANWTNYTHECVGKIFHYLKTNPKYISRFKWTICADEIFYQTIVQQLDGLKIADNCLRYINWVDGPDKPRTLRANDFEKIMSSDALFARKLDADIDRKIINMIYEEVTEK